MKRLLLLLLCQGSLESDAQEYTLQTKDAAVYLVETRIDTLRADLLRTNCRMCTAYDYLGYVVKQGDKVIGYLDDKMKPIKDPGKVWGYKIKRR